MFRSPSITSSPPGSAWQIHTPFALEIAKPLLQADAVLDEHIGLVDRADVGRGRLEVVGIDVRPENGDEPDTSPLTIRG
jgi:hypothetical protein